MCTICLEEFVAGDTVCSLCCGHVFHRACYAPLAASALSRGSRVTADNTPYCPNCRGFGRVVAQWVHVDRNRPQPTQARTAAVRRAMSTGMDGHMLENRLQTAQSELDSDKFMNKPDLGVAL